MHRTGSAISHCPTSNFFLGSGYFNVARAMQKERPVRVGLGTDLGAGTSFSILATLNEAYKAAQLNNYALTAGHAYYLATRGTANAMYIDDKVGSIAPGMEADIVVLDMKSTPIIKYRMEFAKDFLEALFIQMTLGDDRAVQATYVAGELRYSENKSHVAPDRTNRREGKVRTMATTSLSSSPAGAERSLGGPMAWWVWALAVIFVVYLFSFQTGYAIVNSSVQQDIGLTVAQVGTIAAVYTWAFAICQFFGGALLDRLGSRKVLPISIALVTLGIFVFANANSFAMLLLSQVIIALGSCTGFVGAGYIGGKWFGMAKFSFMFGLVQVVAALTSAFSQNLIGFALSS